MYIYIYIYIRYIYTYTNEIGKKTKPRCTRTIFLILCCVHVYLGASVTLHSEAQHRLHHYHSPRIFLTYLYEPLVSPRNRFPQNHLRLLSSTAIRAHCSFFSVMPIFIVMFIIVITSISDETIDVIRYDGKKRNCPFFSKWSGTCS